jgi:hypothetical protein
MKLFSTCWQKHPNNKIYNGKPVEEYTPQSKGAKLKWSQIQRFRPKAWCSGAILRFHRRRIRQASHKDKESLVTKSHLYLLELRCQVCGHKQTFWPLACWLGCKFYKKALLAFHSLAVESLFQENHFHRNIWALLVFYTENTKDLWQTDAFTWLSTCIIISFPKEIASQLSTHLIVHLLLFKRQEIGEYLGFQMFPNALALRDGLQHNNFASKRQWPIISLIFMVFFICQLYILLHSLASVPSSRTMASTLLRLPHGF